MSIVRGSGLRAQLVRSALGVGGLKLISMPLTLAGSILLARVLGPEGYGQYVFVLAVISLLALPVGPGLGQLVSREVAKYHHGEEWGLFRGLLRRAHQWVILGSAVMAVVIALLAARNASWAVNDRWALLLVASLLLPLLGLNALRSSTLLGLRHVIHAQLPEQVVRPGFHLFTVGVLLFAGLLNPATALVSQIGATTGAFLLGVWYLRRLRPVPVGQVQAEYRQVEWGKALLPFTLLSAVGTLNGQLGILTLGWLGTDAQVAALQVAQSGAMLVALPLAIINLVIGPHITRAHRDNDQSRLQLLSRRSARAALAVAIPIALPMIFLGGPIIKLVYGGSYADSAMWAMAILAAAQVLNVAFGSVGLFLTMSGFEHDTLNGQIIALVVNAVAAVLLIPPLGAVGAALAVTAGLVTWNIVLAFKLKLRLGLRPTAL